MRLKPREKKFADKYLDTGKFPDGILRKDFEVIKKWLGEKKKIKIHTRDKDVYFIRCRETGRIKIGMSESVGSRFIALNAMSPTKLEIFDVIDFGGEELEKHFHRKFEKYRYKGEWFEGSKEIVDMVEDIIKIQKNANTEAEENL